MVFLKVAGPNLCLCCRLHLFDVPFYDSATTTYTHAAIPFSSISPIIFQIRPLYNENIMLPDIGKIHKGNESYNVRGVIP